MTSMPASRSARAMIFAPRSCPSSPGLATTTRIFFSGLIGWPVATGAAGRRILRGAWGLADPQAHRHVGAPVDRAVDDIGAAPGHALAEAPPRLEAGAEARRAAGHGHVVELAPAPHPADDR